VLATALAIAAWLRGRVRPEVAVLGGAAFLLNPTIMEKAALGEPDTLVTAFSAIAYLAWLDGRHRPSVGRFAAVAALLALAAMTKQAVMLGFFAGAAILVLALERARPAAWIALAATLAAALVPWAIWAAAIREPGDATQLGYALRLYGPGPGYVLAQLSMLGEYAAETLPWSLAALPALIPPWRRRLGIDAALARPAAAYALACPAVLALWPSAVPRYLMPALPGLVICAALTLESLWLRRWVRRLVLGAIIFLVLAQLGLRLVAMPFYLPGTRASAEAAAAIERIVATAPGPLVVAGLHGFHNAAWYLRPHPRHLRLDEFPGSTRPAWVLTAAPSLDLVQKAWPTATSAGVAQPPLPMILLKIPPP
ncbi:MAG: glycosyltransferase family 39 protein, partial [Rhodospirillales bacterium]|nr:glycosyltransferase family 39 protein [Rhodospirillales bacterium]